MSTHTLLRMPLALVALSAAFLFWLSAPARAADDGLGAATEVVDVQPLPDQGALVLGRTSDQLEYSDQSVWVPFVAKLRADGSTDPAFGSGGVSVLSSPAGLGSPVANLEIVPGTGRILVAGSDRIAALRPDGSPDPSFAAGGELEVPPAVPASTSAAISDFTVSADGGITVGGGHFPSWVRRYTADGAPDESFAGGAAVPIAVEWPRGESSLRVTSAGAVAVDAAGAAYVGASLESASVLDDHTAYGVVRLSPAGQLDQAYGDRGFAAGIDYEDQRALWSRWDVTAIYLDPDGTALLSVEGDDNGYSQQRHTLFEGIGPDGSPQGFGQGIGDRLSFVDDTYRLEDGRLLTAVVGYYGRGEESQVVNDFTGGRMLPSLMPDPALGEGTGLVSVDTLPATRAAAVAPSGDGFVLGGVSGARFCGEPAIRCSEVGVLARFNADGSLDTGYGEDGWAMLPKLSCAAGSTPVDCVAEGSGRIGAKAKWKGKRLRRSRLVVWSAVPRLQGSIAVGVGLKLRLPRGIKPKSRSCRHLKVVLFDRFGDSFERASEQRYECWYLRAGGRFFLRVNQTYVESPGGAEAVRVVIPRRALRKVPLRKRGKAVSLGLMLRYTQDDIPAQSKKVLKARVPARG